MDTKNIKDVIKEINNKYDNPVLTGWLMSDRLEFLKFKLFNV